MPNTEKSTNILILLNNFASTPLNQIQKCIKWNAHCNAWTSLLQALTKQGFSLPQASRLGKTVWSNEKIVLPVSKREKIEKALEVTQKIISRLLQEKKESHRNLQLFSIFHEWEPVSFWDADKKRCKWPTTIQSKKSGKKYSYWFFYKKECSEKDTKKMQKILNGIVPISTPVGERSYFTYFDEEYDLPLSKEKELLLLELSGEKNIQTFLSQQEIKKELLEEKSWILQNLLRPEEDTWFAFLLEKDFVVAFAFGEIHLKKIHVTWVEVHPEFQGQGLCSILMKKTFTMLHEREKQKPIELRNEGEIAGYICYVTAAENAGYTYSCKDCEKEETRQKKRKCLEKAKQEKNCKSMQFSD